jgi:riboflavin synthase
MFTGIIEEIGVVDSVSVEQSSGSLGIKAGAILDDCRLGDSIAVNGVCLTICRQEQQVLYFDVSPETFRRSNLGTLQRRDQVNLERAMAANGRFGGHLVSGHIDGIGRITSRTREANAVLFTFSTPLDISRFTVEKGSIAVDGISLTITGCDRESFSVAVVPHTLQQTILGNKQPGQTVNLEIDQVAKYIYAFMQAEKAPREESSINENFLKKHGFA